ncbi:hypothetical protein A3I99_02500 [Candidatus Kaiserbacteria bacterium RIFCSPLOWO2_02_FULL_45_11b]|uniref:Uncharacterized protein n=1 Tax=Candidatus Kaiserbacteria bacterium RIFCSPLOWO2_12_FULL_45_26 TaxID=1798525 RepID=A0A1F6FF81_9BACT|nr:MAG: hypothetical protein A2Z56_01690 [Candidatus Kaiserbacteria bacterium RIFCSPHIGHO2_12_45_16]OGG70257.1 MAG: hypothetical protein A2929_04245 [Candidatus Kaiserbacteria bacterium RIFCSPLOWO2_01_FULL_45_25]OGG81925.1 MAG: hypothetical protein A3I99_02500 [Candidatus Kaiserbacteria bacterium RIFCSPLOWO2_02_FULL_45_11b]OGG84521.1 MAG: hypothetical protein A3G90_00290 [Candidatus Kaiserbacteria bacterium RIFCSPLOWO2_12_FULL_45_26]
MSKTQVVDYAMIPAQMARLQKINESLAALQSERAELIAILSACQVSLNNDLDKLYAEVPVLATIHCPPPPPRIAG